jgi:hypothetical protein
MMTRGIAAIAAAMVAASATLFAQAQAPVTQKPGTEKPTQANKNLIAEVTTTGCVRLWKPQPGDPTKMPDEHQPGLAGVYLLTPLATNPTVSTDLPTYVLTPSATLNFFQMVGKEVTITGNAQTAPLPPTVQEIATAPTMRPEEKPTTNGMPRLTVTTLKVVKDSCP